MFNNNFKAIAIMTISLSMVACGGGSSEPIPNHANTVSAAIPAIAANVPASKPFTGAFTLLQGESIGYVAATSPEALARAVGQAVVDDPVKFAGFYQIMLGDVGLKVTIVGEAIGKSSITGLTTYAPNVVYTVKLTNSGIVIT